METIDPIESKKVCRVCGKKVNRFYKNHGGRRCVVCLHRTHRWHLAENGRVCSACAKGEILEPAEEQERPVGIRLIHLTDLHFGGKNSDLRLEAIRHWIGQQSLDYILISGDLTARSGKDEYQAAARWLTEIESTGVKVGVVPGNHDIGYWGNVESLAAQPMGRKYHYWIKWIDRPIEPCLTGNHCVILGLNSAHGISPSRLFNGYLSRSQRARASDVLKATPRDYLKVIFCHHPLVRFNDNQHRAMYNAENTRDELMDAGALLFLWGHQHRFESVQMVGSRGNCWVLQSPTLSDRTRQGGLPGFSLIRWIFEQKVVFSVFEVDGVTIEEKKTVEYIFREEPNRPPLK